MQKFEVWHTKCYLKIIFKLNHCFLFFLIINWYHLYNYNNYYRWRNIKNYQIFLKDLLPFFNFPVLWLTPPLQQNQNWDSILNFIFYLEQFLNFIMIMIIIIFFIFSPPFLLFHPLIHRHLQFNTHKKIYILLNKTPFNLIIFFFSK